MEKRDSFENPGKQLSNADKSFEPGEVSVQSVKWIVADSLRCDRLRGLTATLRRRPAMSDTPIGPIWIEEGTTAPDFTRPADNGTTKSVVFNPPTGNLFFRLIK